MRICVDVKRSVWMYEGMKECVRTCEGVKKSVWVGEGVKKCADV